MVGWQNAAGQRWGRPVDVVVHRDGSLLVSDDQAGLILRVAPRR
jgi:glucose/arabinose dehydrogenase